MGPWNMWQHRSLHQKGGEDQGHGIRPSTRARLGKEARSGAAVHVAAPVPAPAGR
jgi:hypothetical protein